MTETEMQNAFLIGPGHRVKHENDIDLLSGQRFSQFPVRRYIVKQVNMF